MRRLALALLVLFCVAVIAGLAGFAAPAKACYSAKATVSNPAPPC